MEEVKSSGLEFQRTVKHQLGLKRFSDWLPVLKIGFGLQLDSGDYVLAGEETGL